MKKNVRIKNLFTILLVFTAGLSSHAQFFDWARAIGAPGQDRGLAVAVDAAGNVYATGHFNDTITLSPGTSGTMNFMSHGKSDIYFAKFSSTGTLLWAKQIGGKEDDSGTSLAVSADQHIYLLATIKDTVDVDPGLATNTMIADNGNLRDIVVSKYDVSGNLVWAKQVTGIGDDQGRSIRIDKQGNVIFAGVFYATPDFDPSTGGVANAVSNGWNDVFVCKWTSAGNFLWVNATGGVDSDEAYGLGIDSSNSVYVTGRFQRNTDFDPGAGTFPMTPVGLLDGFFVKYNSTGAFSWSKRIGCNASVDSSIATGIDIITDKNGNVTLLGSFKKTVDFDPGSGTDIKTPTGKHDVFLSRYDTSGVYSWTKTFGGPAGDDMPGGFTTDKFGNFYIIGYFYSTAYFNPSSTNTNSMTSVGSWDVFINALTNNGSYLWSKRFGAGMFDTGAGIVTDWNGQNIYSTGYFQQIPDFDTETPVFLLQSFGGEDAFVHKILQNNVGISENDAGAFICNMYPNPANSFINVVINSENINSSFLILDAVGRMVNLGKLTSETTSISIESLASGLYFFQLNGANSSYTFKLIKK